MYDYTKTSETECRYRTTTTCQTCTPIQRIGWQPEKLGFLEKISKMITEWQLSRI